MRRQTNAPSAPVHDGGLLLFGGVLPVQHWLPPDADRDVAAEANRPDRAPCREIRACPGLARRLRRLRRLAVVVDVTLPSAPGYECIREAP